VGLGFRGFSVYGSGLKVRGRNPTLSFSVSASGFEVRGKNPTLPSRLAAGSGGNSRCHPWTQRVLYRLDLRSRR
jgi:hypothetical protein